MSLALELCKPENEKDFNKIINIVACWDGFLTMQGRVDLIKDAFYNEEYKDSYRWIKPGINYEGTPEQVAYQTIFRLRVHGKKCLEHYLLTFRDHLDEKNPEDEELKNELNIVLSKYSVI